jgi:AraC family transcriptional activator of pobA
MSTITPINIKSITEIHRLWSLPQPKHPLVSVVDYSKVNLENKPTSVVFNCYSVAIKKNVNFKMIYGQQEYDFDEGVMFFTGPNQVLRIEPNEKDIAGYSGWILFIHPDFLWNTPLAKIIKQYEYFSYAANEALFLSENEEAIVNSVIQNIQQEYNSNIDKFSQTIIISQIGTLLSYAERFYQRQFITRRVTNHKILDRLEEVLTGYFNSDALVTKGQPTVQYIAETLNISPSYLSGILKTLTGRSPQQHIQDKVIETAKEKLSTTDLSVSEIAFQLGFEYPQSFNKLFKSKTTLSPLEFRRSFN